MDTDIKKQEIYSSTKKEKTSRKKNRVSVVFISILCLAILLSVLVYSISRYSADMNKKREDMTEFVKSHEVLQECVGSYVNDQDIIGGRESEDVEKTNEERFKIYEGVMVCLEKGVGEIEKDSVRLEGEDDFNDVLEASGKYVKSIQVFFDYEKNYVELINMLDTVKSYIPVIGESFSTYSVNIEDVEKYNNAYKKVNDVLNRMDLDGESYSALEGLRKYIKSYLDGTFTLLTKYIDEHNIGGNFFIKSIYETWLVTIDEGNQKYQSIMDKVIEERNSYLKEVEKNDENFAISYNNLDGRYK